VSEVVKDMDSMVTLYTISDSNDYMSLKDDACFRQTQNEFRV